MPVDALHQQVKHQGLIQYNQYVKRWVLNFNLQWRQQAGKQWLICKPLPHYFD